jgi:hypothetical protein
MANLGTGDGDVAAQIIAWSQTYQACADAVLQRAHDLFAQQPPAITLAAYNDVLNQKIAVAQQCVAINDAAASALLAGVLAQLAPIQQATADLKKVSSNIAAVQQVATMALELATAVGTVAAAVAAPTVAGIAAAAAAVSTVASSLAPSGGGGAAGGS